MSDVTFVSADLDAMLKEFGDAFSKPKLSNVDVISNAMRRVIYENFATESGDGQPWAPLAPETVEEREFLGFPGTNPILIRTGDLLESLINPNDADHVEEINANLSGFTVDVGTMDERAGRLNNGSGRMPARPFLTADDQQQDEIGAAVEAYFNALF